MKTSYKKVKNYKCVEHYKEAVELLKKVADYNDGKGDNNFSHLDEFERGNEAHDKWMEIRSKIDNFLKKIE